jgi:hypothetical protein
MLQMDDILDAAMAINRSVMMALGIIVKSSVKIKPSSTEDNQDKGTW